MVQTTQKQKNLRGLLTKKPFYRLMPDTPERTDFGVLRDTNEKIVIKDNLAYMEVTQADFRRELDPASHAINDRNVYINYRYNPKDDLYYQEDFPRYAFAYQQEILDDRMARTTGNDMQFDLADDITNEEKLNIYSIFKAGWADKRMENAWHFSIKSDYSVADVAFVGIMTKCVFSWKVLSFNNGDVLYPHYDRITGKLNIFARTYTSDDDEGNTRNYVDVWDDKYYYRLVDADPNESNQPVEQTEQTTPSLNTTAGEFDIDGYTIEDQRLHGFPWIPISYHRRDDGPVWSPSQETIEHREAAFSRLAQNNHDFGLPIMYLKGEGRKIKEIATKDMSYASKIFILPDNGEAGFMKRESASEAYKTELDLLEEKIYSQSMVIKAPELKSGDTPAAAIKLLYSDAYNKALLEIQEYDEFVCKMINIFKWGYGIEKQKRLAFMNTRISFYILPWIPINDAEATNNLATAVQNGFVSKQTASEKFYFSTPQEWKRIQQEKHDDQMQELLFQEQKLDIQTDAQIEVAEQQAEINTEQQIETLQAEQSIENGERTKKTVRTRKGSVATGNGTKRGRPATTGKQWDKWGNEIDPATGKAKSKWDQ
jgi:hypothetical protein